MYIYAFDIIYIPHFLSNYRLVLMDYGMLISLIQPLVNALASQFSSVT